MRIAGIGVVALVLALTACGSEVVALAPVEISKDAGGHFVVRDTSTGEIFSASDLEAHGAALTTGDMDSSEQDARIECKECRCDLKTGECVCTDCTVIL